MLLDGSPYAAIGTMGGEGQPQTQVAMLTRLVDFGYDAQQAIESPRGLIGRTWGAASRHLWLEGHNPDPVAHEVARRRQPVRMLTRWSGVVGHASAIRLHPPTASSRGVPTPAVTAPPSATDAILSADQTRSSAPVLRAHDRRPTGG